MEQVKICLPRAGSGQEPEVFVGVNGVGYRIRKGVELKVPGPVAEVLRHAEEAERANESFLASSWREEVRA